MWFCFSLLKPVIKGSSWHWRQLVWKRVVVSWIMSFLKERKQWVKVFDYGTRVFYSEIADVLSGFAPRKLSWGLYSLIATLTMPQETLTINLACMLMTWNSLCLLKHSREWPHYSQTAFANWPTYRGLSLMLKSARSSILKEVTHDDNFQFH